MLFLGVSIALSCWLLGGNVVKAVPPPAIASSPSPAVQAEKPTKVVFFGSSTTVGVGATRGDRRWSTLLSRYLGWQEYNESLSGSSLSTAPRTDKTWDIPAAVQRWEDAILRRRPDKIVMMYGANDALWKLPLGDRDRPKPATFRGDLNTLLAEMTAVFRPEQLVILTPQPNQATLDRRKPYDEALQAGAKKIGAYFVDAVKETFPAEDLADFSADGLHLNDLGHAAFASALAGKLVDLGVAPPPPLAEGGNSLPKAKQSLPGGSLRVDLARPLSFGEIRSIAARWVAPGNARFLVMRPDARGGYEAIYRTPVFAVKPGTASTPVPRWWVLDGDRLAVWTDTDCLGSRPSLTRSPQHLAIERDAKAAMTDISRDRGNLDDRTLAIWTAS